jgi:ABC-type multidrug transport system fused ATPase/permease subunit
MTAQPDIAEKPKRRGVLREVGRGWMVVEGSDRRRFALVSAYGILIAGLDTIALVLLYALTTLLANETPSGISATFFGHGKLTSDERYHDTLVLLLITAGLFVARSCLSVFGLWLTIGTANNAQANLVARLLFGHARAAQLVRLDRNSSETLRTISMSINQVVTGIVGGSVTLISNLAVTVAVLLGLVISSPTVALTVAVYFGVLSLVWVRGVRGTLQRRGHVLQELAEEQYRLILQGIAAAKELQLRGRAVFYAEEAVDRTRAINTAYRALGVVNGSLRYVLEAALVVGALLIVGTADLVGGRSAVLPAVGLVLAAAFRLLPALNQVLFLVNSVQYNAPAIDLVEEEIRTFGSIPIPSERSGAPVEPHPLRDAVQLDGVTFRYPSRTDPAVRNVALTINAGESIGIVGPTGSGKSTLLDIILGLLEPNTGTVTIDGAPVAACREAWQRSIGYVPQDVYLADDTLRANVALGWRGRDIDDAAVEQAIRLAQLEDVVPDLPDGLDTRVGERGVRLSGGQRQRVGLARALYVKPTVLVLDEATSSLDTVTERRIVDTLAALEGRLTMVIVTHRIPTVRYCDRILYLEKGSGQVMGSYEELTGFMADHPALIAAARS